MNIEEINKENNLLKNKQNDNMELLLGDAQQLKKTVIKTNDDINKQRELLIGIDIEHDKIKSEVEKNIKLIDKIIVIKSQWKLYIIILIEFIIMILLLF